MGGGSRFSLWMLALAVLLIIGLSSCQVAAPLTSTPAGDVSLESPTWTTAPGQSLTQPPTPLPTPKPVFYEPAGCWQPPEDYTRVQINGHIINARTYAMLQQAAMLFGGEIDVAGSAIIQGSYTESSEDSLGIHLGGGVVDISVMRLNTEFILYSEIEPLIRALRTVGFAAWLREDGEEGSESTIYIHAVAIGDKDLSEAAMEQITGPAGYMSGYNGISVTSNDPVPDRYGGPVICHWMLDAGYADMRPASDDPSAIPWQERLRQAALAYQAFYPEDAVKVAHSLNFLDGESESASNICGPLSAAILRDAGLLPDQAGPVQDLKSFWLASPALNGRPWSLFPESDYEVFRFTTPMSAFDFTAWPLQPADFVYAYAENNGYDHMFVITEVDAEGRAYTVTNQNQSWGSELWGSMIILRYMLYDPLSPGEGIIYNEWSNPRLGMTGQKGFEVLRKRGLAPGSLYEYTIHPGDTLPNLAARFGADLESLIQANDGMDLTNLQVSQVITIPIPSYQPPSQE